jgi:hypothetical protein
LGQLVFVNLFEFFEPQFNSVTIKVTEIQKGISTSVLFSITLFLIPVLIIVTWRFSPIILTTKKIVSGLIVLVLISFSIWIRHIEVKAFYTHLIKKGLIHINLDEPVIEYIDPVNFVYYMFGGLCLGCFASFIFLRQKKNDSIRKS